MDPAMPLAIDLPERGSRRLVKALHGQLRSAIVTGRLQPGLRLPSSRALARQHGVSRNCVIAVYDLLVSEGYAAARPRGGTYVAAAAHLRRNDAHDTATSELRSRFERGWRTDASIVRFRPAADFDFDFAVGMPDVSAFPFDAWRRAGARALRAFAQGAGEYAEPEGRPWLREQIAAHVSQTRAVACDREHIVVTCGAQEAFNLLAHALVTPGKTVVAVEDPGYPPLHWAFERWGAQLVPVPVDAEGIVVESIPRTARVICVTPSHQFPMGYVMSARRRTALLELARRHRAIVIEDDYDGEFSHTGRPLDALQTLDGSRSVFYVGTFSKCLFPGLRLGFVVVPDWARDAVVAAKQRSDWHAALLAQDTLAAFIADGHLMRHIRKMRGIYRERRNALIAALQGLASLEVVPAEAGLHVTALLPARKRAARVAAVAADNGIRLYSLEWFTRSARRPNGILCGLGPIPTPRVEKGVMRLAQLLRQPGRARAE